MNLVMSDITRNKLGCYMAQQASLNNIPVSALVSRFTVEPSVQQRFENASKESTEFTKRINVIGVTDQKGEKILLDTTGPIARTNTSYDGTKRRNQDMPDEVRAKLCKACAFARRGLTDADSMASSLKLLREAMHLNPNAGVKREIATLSRALKKADSADASEDASAQQAQDESSKSKKTTRKPAT